MTLKYGTFPIRAADGYIEPRLLEVGPITRQSSDPATGSWSAQTATIKYADTDRVNRGVSQARTSLRNCTVEIYLTSNANRLAGGPPRVMFAGIGYSDAADENLASSLVINDLFGASYSLFSEEKQIPQRVVSTNYFPLAPTDSLGQAEQIVGGRRAPLDPTKGEGVVPTVLVGSVVVNGAHGTPTGTDLASVVAALEASRAAGTLYVDFGSRIGYNDAIALQNMGSVPSDYDALAQVIGYSDLDALLAQTAVVGGDTFVAVMVGAHAIKEVLNGSNGNPSIWIDDTQIAPGDIGTSVWCPQIPGDTSWASAISTDLFTDIIGSDGTTRRYTLILFDPGSTHGIAVAGGAKVHLDCIGMERTGNGLGTAITDYFELYKHVMINFLLQDYQYGPWLNSPQFLFSDGVTLIDRVDSVSFETASTVSALSLTGGYVGSFTIKDRSSVRNILERFNLSGGCLLAQDDYGRLVVKVIDRRRAQFLTNPYGVLHETLRDKVDFVGSFTIEPKPDWQVNVLTYQYAKNDYTGNFERGAGSGGSDMTLKDDTSIARDGTIKRSIDLAYVRDDATARAVAQYYLDLFKNLPHVAHYTRRGLCGLKDDILDGVPITHYNGYGTGGWIDHCACVLSKTFDSKTMTAAFTALDVEGLILAEENPPAAQASSDPVGLELAYSDVGGQPAYPG